MTKKILVVGDVMLDRYWFGDVTRLSQEAPVPVVRWQQEERRAGAAANVALNCISMGAETTLLSAVGNDPVSHALESMVKNSVFLYHTKGTTQKLRVIGKQQQIVRIDFDSPISEVYSTKVAMKFDEMVRDFDIIILSDYNKGVLRHVSEMIQSAHDAGKIVLVDPKGHDYSKYRGASLIKPNKDEMREMVGGWGSEEELAEKTKNFLADGGFGAVLLTRAAQGMTLFTNDKPPFHVPSEARNVYDVTGAGDVSIAAFAVSLARGLNWNQATTCASKAAGLSVERFGTVQVTEAEVFL